MSVLKVGIREFFSLLNYKKHKNNLHTNIEIDISTKVPLNYMNL